MPLYLGNRPIGGTNVSFTPGTGGSEDLTAVLNEQDAIITRLETALEGKALGGGSGGANIETCTVTATTEGVFMLYNATQFIDEQFVAIGENIQTDSLNLNNIVSGSTFTLVVANDTNTFDISITNAIEITRLTNFNYNPNSAVNLKAAFIIYKVEET